MIQDSYISEVAQAMAGEEFYIPGYSNVSSTLVSGDIDATDTALEGEIGDRIAVTISRSTNSISYSSIRSGTTDIVAVSGGDLINGFGTFIDDSTDTLMTQIALDTPFTQTSSFDVELITTITIARDV